MTLTQYKKVIKSLTKDGLETHLFEMFKSSKVFKDIESSYIMTIRMRVNDKMVGDIICPNTNCSSEEMYRHVRDHLKSIDSQEVTITGILNEKYDDWYDDCGEEFYYDDNETFH